MKKSLLKTTTKLVSAPIAAFGLTLLSNAVLAANQNLTLDVYNADGNSFHVNSTLIIGDSEVMLVDTGFTKADGLRIAAKVLDSGKPLKTIFISQADPDFYFGAEVLKQVFPEAKVITTPAVRQSIEKKMAGKLAYWGPLLGANAPQQPVLPEAYEGKFLTIDGHTIEIRGTTGELASRPYLWIKDSKAILGDIAVFGGLHLWTADTQTKSQLDAWNQQLDAMLALQPAIVIPGHMAANTELTASAIEYSKDYLANFRQALKQYHSSAEVKAAMQQQYPQAGLGIALELGSKVHTGEMKW
ncbi:MBL fold metallo-hydrolase [Oceanobacter mangrovi]|uniref:MBL fold metallo-hydrolase n=1 Tax=Oceanobacter mangrovi TaxID=2862510 RepID=UPI001C8DAE3D|nr:MBL fold metallo-hydrolase [Oceanobacter mangrovi]